MVLIMPGEVNMPTRLRAASKQANGAILTAFPQHLVKLNPMPGIKMR